jgi:hypothetical protein
MRKRVRKERNNGVENIQRAVTGGNLIRGFTL